MISARTCVLVAEQLAQLADALDQVGVLAPDRVGLERGQLLQAQVEDRLGLDLGEPEALHQALAGGVAVARAADQLDHRVEVVERDQQALEEVRRASSVRSSCFERRTMTSRWCST